MSMFIQWAPAAIFAFTFMKTLFATAATADRTLIVDRICGVWLSLCVCVRLASVSRLASRICLRAFVSRASRVCVHLSRVRLASVSRLACVSRLSASVHVKGSECVRLVRLRAFVSRASRVCLRLSRVSRLASVSRLYRVCLASVSRRSSCLASVSRRSSCLASVSRRSSCLASVCLLVNACGDWLILCRSSFKEFKRFLLSSYYRCTYRLCRLYEQTFNILI